MKKTYGSAIENRVCCGTRDGAEDFTDMVQNNYDKTTHAIAPEDIIEQSFGCGNPVEVAGIKKGERVLDLGCGAGLDMILACRAVGEEGHVYGIDMTPEMLGKARANFNRLGLKNATLLKGYVEELPLHDESVDVIISNCVINLSPDKEMAFAEAYRVLTVGGRFCVSDVVLLKPVLEKLKSSPEAWSG